MPPSLCRILAFMSAIQAAKKVGRKFQNPIQTGQIKGSFFGVLYKYATSKEERDPAKPLGPFTVDKSIFNTAPSKDIRITWMGHSSMIIEVDGKRLLTDPVMGRASFVQWAGPKRFFDYPLAIEELPPLDAVILSHDHYDHLDMLVIKKLAASKVPFYCSTGVGAHLERWGIARERITEMTWGQREELGDGFSITATPCRHFSGRGIINRNETLWSSFVLRGPKSNVFFGADSGWFPGFHDIGKEFGPFDLTMLEVGAYNESWPDIHMGPDNATNAHLALKGRVMMPIHWGTFNLSLHSWREPVELSMKYAQKKNIKLFLPKPGAVTEVDGEHVSKWWD